MRGLVPGRSGLGGLTPDERGNPDLMLSKFRTGGLNVIRAGGGTGKYSAIISAIGSAGLRLVIREITS